jgi:hypothetical protein
MEEYVKAKPFICIKSETYFTFAKQWLKEAQNVLLNLARYRPSNFGISVGILMHMIHYVCHMPIKVQKCLEDALQDVNFQEIMKDDGIFFLHALDLECHCILEIPSSDPADYKVEMSKG